MIRMMNDSPLVSIIIPTTYDREFFNKRIEGIIHKQTYPNIEPIFCYDASSIGHKRNMACEMATGDIVIHFDSDDYYAPDFISNSVAFLLSSKADVTGLSAAYFVNVLQGRAWLYEYKSKMPYVIGSGMCYYKRVWERNKFRDINEGEDKYFLANAGYIKPHGYIDGFCASIHPKNTCSHKSLRYMTEISYDFLIKRLNFDLS